MNVVGSTWRGYGTGQLAAETMYDINDEAGPPRRDPRGALDPSPSVAQAEQIIPTVEEVPEVSE